MQITRIPYHQIPQLSVRDRAYAEQNPQLRAFYEYEPRLAEFERVLADRAQQPVDRSTLVQVLLQQYSELDTSEALLKQIKSLERPTTFTVVTAHQPSLFTGPLYFIYKIAGTINLARQLRAAYPDYHIVPVFVVGGEDHDFAEINHTHLFGKTISWEDETGGPVGQLSTEGLAPALAAVQEMLGDSPQAQDLIERLQRSYGTEAQYGRATLSFVHELFRDHGLVVLDMNQPVLKRLFIPVMRAELVEQPSQAYVERAQRALEKLGFSGQAYAREINLFYLKPGLRARIVREGDDYKVLTTNLQFTQAELLAELETHPEHFSPNVIMRPLYQETILPNLAYVGGGGELAYWLERREQFAHFGLNFPMLIRRNSVLWIDRNSAERMEKLGLQSTDLFLDTEKLVKQFVRANTENELTLAEEKQSLASLFERIAAKAHEVDPTLEKAVLAEHARQHKAVENLEGRLMRAEKQHYETSLNQLRKLRERLFPNDGLQERHDNFMPLYLQHGTAFIDQLVDVLDPLEPGFVVIVDNE